MLHATDRLTRVEVRECLTYSSLNVMNLLNEIVSEFPDAISFAPGRPLESLFRVEDHLAALDQFVREAAARTKSSRESVLSGLAQYGRTNGIVAEAIAAHLACDEQIHVAPADLIVTVGAQEAMA